LHETDPATTVAAFVLWVIVAVPSMALPEPPRDSRGGLAWRENELAADAPPASPSSQNAAADM
jgi:hypothetical protein